MNKFKILNCIIIGNILINVPILCFSFFELFWPSVRVDFVNIFFVFSLSLAYWCIMIPYYKLYSVKKINTKEEYLLWEKWSVITLLFWPNRYKFYRFECWSKKNLNFYKAIRRRLLEL